MTFLAKIDALANDGWCVVLKRLPPGRGWVIEGSRSEYDAPSADQTVGKNLWLCELHDMNFPKGNKLRRAVDGMGKTAQEAVKMAFNAVQK